jgi:uncharacterized membrane protein
VVLNPWGLTVPLSVAEELVTFVAGLVITTGGPVALSVVKVMSLPYLVPPLLVATTLKWYVVLALKLLIFALTLWNVLPVLVWEDVVCP